MRKLTWLLVVLVVLAAALFVGDRLAANAASDRIASAIESDAHLAHKPSVTVHGFPFVAQALRGRYDRIDVVADDVFAHGEGGDGSTVSLEFRGVHIPPSKALSGDVHRIPVDRVSGTVAVAFADLEAASHLPGLTLSQVPGHADELALGEQVTVAGVSAAARLTARLAVSGHELRVSPTDISVTGVPVVPDALLAPLEQHAAFSVDIPGVPGGVSLSGVTVAPGHVDLGIAAQHVVLVR